MARSAPLAVSTERDGWVKPSGGMLEPNDWQMSSGIVERDIKLHGYDVAVARIWHIIAGSQSMICPVGCLAMK